MVVSPNIHFLPVVWGSRLLWCLFMAPDQTCLPSQVQGSLRRNDPLLLLMTQKFAAHVEYPFVFDYWEASHYITLLVGGWSNPFEKYAFEVWSFPQLRVKIQKKMFNRLSRLTISLQLLKRSHQRYFSHSSTFPSLASILFELASL